MLFPLALIGSIFELVGKILLAIAVLMVHQRMVKEHKLDHAVVKEIQHERILSLIAIFFMIGGFSLKIWDGHY